MKMLSDKLELIYWSDDGDGATLPLEEWQFQAMVQVLGLSVTEDEMGLKMSSFSKKTVIERLRKMGILVTPEQYKQIKGEKDE